MPIATSHIDLTTVLISAGVSAVIAAFTSWLFNFALGGRMEVRKRRAVRRDDALADLEQGVRTLLNATWIINKPAAWHAEGNKVTGFTDDAEAAFDEMEETYQRIRTHFAGRGGRDHLEQTVGWAVNMTGTLTGRVMDFRQGAIGHPPDGLTKEHDAMVADLEAAQEILTMARDCLRVSGLRRSWRCFNLLQHLRSVEAEAQVKRIPKTPRAYTASLPPTSPESSPNYDL
jgi:hypothetical protein